MKRAITLLIVAVATGPACRSAAGTSAPPGSSSPAIIQPGAPGEPNRTISREAATDLSRVQATPADVKFMQGMIGHHAQALEMTALIADRTARDDMKLLGQRIAVSQADEIEMMKAWLRVRSQEVPAEHAHHTQEGFMPGMLTAEQMAELGAAKGPLFDELFLKGMIQHHAGALTMVDELFTTPGAGQEGDINAFAADVDSDQRTEINRMRAMLGQK